MEEYIEEKLQETYNQKKIEFEVNHGDDFREYIIYVYLGREVIGEILYIWDNAFTNESNYNKIGENIDRIVLQYYKNEL